jgi:SAM-dependent methyltransferase
LIRPNESVSIGDRDRSACPACGSTSTISTGPKAPQFAMMAGDETFVQPDYFVRECGDCGLLFRTPTISQPALDRYYAKIDFREWETDGFFPTERCALKILRELPLGSTMLDFGCSSGRLLAPLTENYECYGVEVNKSAAREAAQKGIKILSGDDLDATDAPMFHSIVIVDLFEHMSRPLELLSKLSQRLTDNGRLLIATGNGDAAACRLDPALFWYFRNLQHLCMLTRKHAGFICDRLGLHLEQWIELKHYDLSLREKTVQVLQNFVFWQFRRRTLLARFVFRFLPGMRELKLGKLAPNYTCSRDHVVAVFCKEKQSPSAQNLTNETNQR